jgi:opacity protein-like surface antigen
MEATLRVHGGKTMKFHNGVSIFATTSLILLPALATAQEGAPYPSQETETETEFEAETQLGGELDIETEQRVDTAPAQPGATEPVAEESYDINIEQQQPPAIGVYEEPRFERERRLMTDIGVGVILGGGVQGFIESDARDFTDVGGAWGLRLALGTDLPVGAEIGYLGAAQNITALGLDQGAFLLTNGAEAAARINFLTGMVQPYALAGAGWTNFRVTNEDFNTSSIASDDNIVHFPVGLGLAGRLAEGLMLDARGVVRAAPSGDLFAEDDGNMHTWGVNLSAGYEF